MGSIIFILIATFVLLLLIYLVVDKKKLKKVDTNQNALYGLGLIYFIIGISNNMSAMWVIGVVFFITGLAQKRKLDAKN